MGYPPNPLRNFALCKKKNRRVPNQWFQPQKIFKFYNKKRDILHQTLGLVFLSLTLKCFNSHFLPSTYLQAPKNSLKNSWNKPKIHLRKTNRCGSPFNTANNTQLFAPLALASGGSDTYCSQKLLNDKRQLNKHIWNWKTIKQQKSCC